MSPGRQIQRITTNQFVKTDTKLKFFTFRRSILLETQKFGIEKLGKSFLTLSKRFAIKTTTDPQKFRQSPSYSNRDTYAEVRSPEHIHFLPL